MCKSQSAIHQKVVGTHNSEAFIQGKFRNYENKTGGQPYCHAGY